MPTPTPQICVRELAHGCSAYFAQSDAYISAGESLSMRASVSHSLHGLLALCGCTVPPRRCVFFFIFFSQLRAAKRRPSFFTGHKSRLRVTAPALCSSCRADGWIETPRCQFDNHRRCREKPARPWGRWQSRRLAPGGFAVCGFSSNARTSNGCRACHSDGTKQHAPRLAHGWLQVVPSPTKKLRMSICGAFLFHPPAGAWRWWRQSGATQASRCVVLGYFWI